MLFPYDILGKMCIRDRLDTPAVPSGGGGGSSNDLPWGRREDEDEREWARRCAREAAKMCIRDRARIRWAFPKEFADNISSPISQCIETKGKYCLLYTSRAATVSAASMRTWPNHGARYKIILLWTTSSGTNRTITKRNMNRNTPKRISPCLTGRKRRKI